MKPLKGKVAVVSGASRGAGRGIALALGEAGATVYVAARTVRGGLRPPGGVPGTIEDTAEETHLSRWPRHPCAGRLHQVG